MNSWQNLNYSNPRFTMKSGRKNRFLYPIVAILGLGLIIILLNMYQIHSMRLDHELHHQDLRKIPVVEAMSIDQTKPMSDKPIVWIQGSGKSKNDNNGRYSYLKHVHVVFENMGFSVGEKNSDWVVLWAHDYPFVTYEDIMKNLKPYHRINHFPGSGYITNKVTLAQTNFEFIPKAFEMPWKKKDFIEYSEKHPNMSWVQKSNKHRGIEVKDRHSLDLSKEGSFIQRYISNPFLIDGYKFDIGIYTIISSIDPLRVYFIDGDALFRFCSEVYYPFDDSILKKYVVGDDYLPMWEIPSLKATFAENGFTFRDSFNEYLRRKGIDATAIWLKMTTAIKQVVLAKENDLKRAMQKYKSKRNFFEMVRFDFVLDDKLNVFLMEANMSPNLSSDHFAGNARLYEHVMFNLLNLVGIGHFTSFAIRKHAAYYEYVMRVSSSDIRVFPDYCESDICLGSCKRLPCKLCKKCVSSTFENDLKIAYLEHMQRGSSRRVFPPAMTHSDALNWHPDSNLEGFNEKNKLMYLWFIGKCRLDPGWCY